MLTPLLYEIWKKKPRVAVVGDVMVDQETVGTAARLSSEAPIPILGDLRHAKRLGGGANVAANLWALGVEAPIISVVGQDEAGSWLKASIEGEMHCILTDSARPTTVKHRIFSDRVQMLRIDTEATAPIPNDAQARLIESILGMALDAIVISDYGKGVVTESICRAAISKGVPVIVDSKRVDVSWFKGCSVYKPNLDEGRKVSRSKADASPIHVLKKLRGCVNAGQIMMTASEQGVFLSDSDGKIHHLACKTDKNNVVDVCGAGDTVSASVAAAVALGVGDPALLMSLAMGCADTVVKTRGTCVLSVPDIVTNAPHAKHVSLELLRWICDRCRPVRKIVLTNGCFDLWHQGHLDHLSQCAEAGNMLVVALNTDESIRRLKGETRPIIKEDHRVAKMCALPHVDFVVLFDDDTPLRVVEAIQPDVLAKSAKDYTVSTVIGRDYAREVLLTRPTENLSTTDIIKTVKQL